MLTRLPLGKAGASVALITRAETRYKPTGRTIPALYQIRKLSASKSARGICQIQSAYASEALGPVAHLHIRGVVNRCDSLFAL